MNSIQTNVADRAQFQWRNCDGDAGTHRYSQIALDYWNKVAKPALICAENEVAYWANSDSEAAPFYLSDMVDQHAVTAAAMCLSIQSIWERQLRSYLAACARDIEPGDAMQKKIQKPSWMNLQALFLELRGVKMSAFISFPKLDLLAQLGNVCRHGDGQSAENLRKSNPELWPDYSRTPSAADIEISTEMLYSFTVAISEFWTMVEYLYHEGITRKHWHLEEQLIHDRQTFAAAISHFNKAVMPT